MAARCDFPLFAPFQLWLTSAHPAQGSCRTSLRHSRSNLTVGAAYLHYQGNSILPRNHTVVNSGWHSGERIISHLISVRQALAGPLSKTPHRLQQVGGTPSPSPEPACRLRLPFQAGTPRNAPVTSERSP